MCTREQYSRFAREPESRKVGVDARITIEGTAYEVEPDMAGETVTLPSNAATPLIAQTVSAH